MSQITFIFKKINSHFESLCSFFFDMCLKSNLRLMAYQAVASPSWSQVTLELMSLMRTQVWQKHETIKQNICAVPVPYTLHVIELLLKSGCLDPLIIRSSHRLGFSKWKGIRDDTYNFQVLHILFCHTSGSSFPLVSLEGDNSWDEFTSSVVKMAELM